LFFGDAGRMTTEQMRERLLVFAIDVLQMTRRLPDDYATRHVCGQLFRSASSVACNYRTTTLARSSTEFLAKLGVVREEADETAFWLEFLDRANMLTPVATEGPRLRKESGEIFAMVSAAYRTSRERYGRNVGKAKDRRPNATGSE
jgi:four helix bundle protein